MNCQQAKSLVHAYADGELEAAAILEIEQHFQNCPGCASDLRNLQSLKKSLRSDALYFTAPAELRQRIKSELPSPRMAVPQNWAWNWNWLTAATSGAFAVCLALLLMMSQARPSSEKQLAQEVVSSHALDVVSTDQHTVKPWFNGKLDFSPPVKDLSAQGFPLSGGRLDYLGGRSVAALVYQRQKHIINVFVWPTNAGDLKALSVTAGQGYHLIHWVEGGMVFWAVSDLNQKELSEFVQDFETVKAFNP